MDWYTFWLALFLGASGLIIWNLMRAPVLGSAARAEEGDSDRLSEGR